MRRGSFGRSCSAAVTAAIVAASMAAPAGAAATVAPAGAAATVAPAAGTAAAASPRPSPGCRGSARREGGDLAVRAAGLTGHVLVQLPPLSPSVPSAAGVPRPLILDLHGYAETAEVEVAFSGLSDLADQHGVAVARPQIDRPVPRWDTSADSADIAFIAATLDVLGAATCLDLGRVYVVGLSNGAQMTSRLACAMSSRIAAVAMVAGVQHPRDCAPSRPMPVLVFHGTADRFLPFEGGLGPAIADLPDPSGNGKSLGPLVAGSIPVGAAPSVPDSVAAWAAGAGCASAVVEVRRAADVAWFDYLCPADVDVQLYRVDGGGHSWPGSAFSGSLAAIVGPTTTSISANALMWEFFQRFALPGETEVRSLSR